MLSRRSLLSAAALAAAGCSDMGLGSGIGRLGFNGAGAIGPTPILLNVSNRSRIHTANQATAETWQSKSYHNLFCGAGYSLTSLQVAWPNWFGDEVGNGGPCAIQLWVEYPIGVLTRQQVNWSGSPNGTILDAATGLCDPIALNTPIPNGAKVGFWAEQTPSVAISFCDAHAKSTAFGDALHHGVGGMTSSSAFPSDNAPSYIGPIAIIGLCATSSIIVPGDSRDFGSRDQASSDGLNGEIGRMFGSRYPIMNFGIPGAQASGFVTKHALRIALAQYANYLIWQPGINDCPGNTPAAIEANAALAKRLGWRTGTRKTRTTWPPVSNSTNNWSAPDGSDQTTNAAYDPNRRAQNATTVTNADGWDAVYDLARVNELAPVPSGKWKADGTPNKYVVDGTHEPEFGNDQYAIAYPTLL